MPLWQPDGPKVYVRNLSVNRFSLSWLVFIGIFHLSMGLLYFQGSSPVSQAIPTAMTSLSSSILYCIFSTYRSRESAISIFPKIIYENQNKSSDNFGILPWQSGDSVYIVVPLRNVTRISSLALTVMHSASAYHASGEKSVTMSEYFRVPMKRFMLSLIRRQRCFSASNCS